tara:strand:+ start:34412 stop:35143 length:732 start_codon:yes stop_codon:yes gene_type:complete
MVQAIGGLTDFTNKLIHVMDEVEYRRITSAEDMEDVARLRHKAYKKADILPIKGDMLIDEIDFDSHAYVFGIYYDEKLISTIRIHHVTPTHRVSISGKVFPDTVNSLLDAGMSLIDPVRHASDPDLFDHLPALPFLTLRIATMATDYFNADYCLSLIPPQHAAFYRRVFRSTQIVAPQSGCGGYNTDLTLMSTHVPVELPKVYKRYPFFKSQPFERRMMFAPLEELGMMPLTILPTARYLQAA